MKKRSVRSVEYINEVDLQRKKKPVRIKDLDIVFPKNDNQRYAMEEFFCGQNLTLLGSAGVGKTFLAMYLAMREVLDPSTEYSKVVVIRSAVPVRDVGFLPGDLDEKIEVYEQPYKDIVNQLLPYKSGWESMKENGQAEFITTSYIRGITLKDTVAIVDECQSLNAHELDSIITRLGTNCKIIFCGDYIQTDLHGRERGGLESFMKIIKQIDSFSNIEFSEDDIVRSGIVRDYIIKRNKLGLAV